MNELDVILRLANCDDSAELFEMADSFDIELSEDFVIESGIVGFAEDGVIIEGDEKLLSLLKEHGVMIEETSYIFEAAAPDPEMQDILNQLDLLAAKQPKPIATRNPKVSPIRDLEDYRIRRKNLIDVLKSSEATKDTELRQQTSIDLQTLDDEAREKGLVTEQELEEIHEAEYRGRKVPLNKPMRGDVKKSKVYVKKPNGKVVKVEFGDKSMRIKKSNPARRRSFRARHRCENPGPKWKARYWSCRAW